MECVQFLSGNYTSLEIDRQGTVGIEQRVIFKGAKKWPAMSFRLPSSNC
jgi:hypothetical protein